MPSNLARRLEEIRHSLLDVGSHNPLVDLEATAAKSCARMLWHPDSDALWHTFLAFEPVPLQGPEHRFEGALTVAQGEANQLRDALRALGQQTRTTRQESGVHTLHVAFGVLRYSGDGQQSARLRAAPLLMLPVDLLLHDGPLRMALRLRRPVPLRTDNGTLARRLAALRLVLPQAGVDAVPSEYAAAVAHIAAGHKTWQVEPAALHLGRFAHGRTVMHHDVSPERWPEGALDGHPLLGLLLGTDTRAQVAPKKVARPYHVVPADAAQAEAVAAMRAGSHLVVQGPPGTGKSQTIANMVAAALHDGKRVLFVAQKLAALQVVQRRLQAVGLGPVVLPLFEHDGQPHAVLAQLQATLHSAATAPEGWATRATAQREAADAEADGLARALTEHDALLHAPIGDSGLSAHEVMGILAQGRPLLRALFEADVASWSAARMAELEARLTAFVTELADFELDVRRAFARCRNTALQPYDMPQLSALCATGRQQLRAVHDTCAAYLQQLGCTGAVPISWRTARACAELQRLLTHPLEPRSLYTALMGAPLLAEVHEALQAGVRWQRHQEAHGVPAPRAGPLPLAWMEQTFAAAQGTPLGRLTSAYRAASRLLREAVGPRALPPTPKGRRALTERLQEEAVLRDAWGVHTALLAAVLLEHWAEADSDFAALAAAAAKCLRLRQVGLPIDAARCVQLSHGVSEAGAFDGLLQAGEETAQLLASTLQQPGWATCDGALVQEEAELGALEQALVHYPAWVRSRAMQDDLAARGVAPLASALWAGTVAPADALPMLRHARAAALWQRLQSAGGGAPSVADPSRAAVSARYQALQARLQQLRVEELLAHCSKRVPDASARGMAELRAQLHGLTSRATVRGVFAALGDTLGAIKPVMLMSPMSVAQHLTPDLHRFDVVIIDEASQMRPEDALGAVMRARQLVVVGDAQQLPPSAFFTQAGSVDDADDILAQGDGADSEAIVSAWPKAAAHESILTLCLARGLPCRTLTWHYRSRVPELMAVSNAAFYHGALVLPASAHGGHPAYGLRLHRVPGVYSSGGSRTNAVEALHVARAVAEHARVAQGQSLGVVTFSLAQRRAVLQALHELRQTDGKLHAFLAQSGPEAVFVKNIESVQGDERDVIVISVGYGPQVAQGPLPSLNFGPINGPSGTRRLNVLFTRARLRCSVFVSFAPELLQAAAAAQDGVRLLGRYLQAAHEGRPSLCSTHAPDTDAPQLSPLLQDVAAVLTDGGFAWSHAVGPPQLPIELAVHDPAHPERFLLAIDTGGLRPLWAASVAQVPQVYAHHGQLLRHMGWRCHRIEAARWLLHKEQEVTRLREALYAALAQARGAVLPQSCAQPYVRAVLAPRGTTGAVGDDELLALVRRVVALEGPIHTDVLAARVAGCAGGRSTGPAWLRRVEAAVTVLAEQKSQLWHEPPFCCTPQQKRSPPVRDRSRERGAVQKVASISPWELRAALGRAAQPDGAVLHQGRSGDGPAQLRRAACLLGFAQVHPALAAAFAAARAPSAALAPAQGRRQRYFGPAISSPQR